MCLLTDSKNQLTHLIGVRRPISTGWVTRLLSAVLDTVADGRSAIAGHSNRRMKVFNKCRIRRNGRS